MKPEEKSTNRAELIYWWKVAVSRGDKDAESVFYKEIKKGRPEPVILAEPVVELKNDEPVLKSALPVATEAK